MPHYYGIIGAGGYGREVMPLARANLADRLGRHEIELYFVVEGDVIPHLVNGMPLISMEAFRALNGPRYFNIAIGNSTVRERLALSCIEAGMTPFPVIAPNVVMLDYNEIGEGGIFCPFTMVTSNAKIGNYFHANIYSYVAHDCVIGDYVTFAPGVKCNGKVIIEDHAYIGTGAVIKEGSSQKPLRIGRGAVVGMGAVVTKDVPPGSTVVGNPARPMEKK